MTDSSVLDVYTDMNENTVIEVLTLFKAMEFTPFNDTTPKIVVRKDPSSGFKHTFRLYLHVTTSTLRKWSYFCVKEV